MEKFNSYLASQKIYFNWRIFWISMAVVFAMVMLPYLGLKLKKTEQNIPAVIQSQQQINVLDSVKPKLQQKVNDFHLKKSMSFISSSYAYQGYEQAAAYGVVDFNNGEIIAQKNLEDRLPIASLTKVMTAVVALDLAGPQDSFTVSEESSKMIPTTIGVVPGEKLTLQELLNALLLTSGNDAADVIKNGIDQKYGDGVFVKAMNNKAQFLGLKNSSFENPEGFDNPTNYSSVEDLVILSHYALTNYPLIESTVRKDYQLLPANQDHKQFDLYNWNGLLDVYPNVEGVKIGNTDDAGKTSIVLSEREGSKIMTVLLGAPGILERDLWASNLLDLGFSKKGLAPINITQDQLMQKYSTWKYWN